MKERKYVERSPTNKWELWADGSHRLTTNSNLLHLIVWKEKGGGWYYRVIQLSGKQLSYSRKPASSRAVAQQLCMRAAQGALRATLKALESVEVNSDL
jgi:hypothetical protein